MLSIASHETSNPLDLIETVAVAQNWAFDRTGEDEIDIVLSGVWGEYPVAVNWREDLEAVHIAAEVDIRIPDSKRNVLFELLSLINEQLFLGHFDLWTDENVILFRYGLVLHGGAQATSEQCEELLQMSLAACDRFYPAFQYLVWAGRSAREAMAAALFETHGEA